MPTPLSSQSSIEILRRTAKRWLKSIEEADPEALARFQRIFPSHAAIPKLREVQQALAREHGFESWAALKRELEDRQRTLEECIHLFIEKSVHRYGTHPTTQKWGDYERDGPTRGALAARLLSRHPDLAHQSILTADPSRVNHQDRPGETPIFSLPSDEEKAMGLAELLLTFGADPSFRNPKGQTPAQVARSRDLDDVAALMDDAAKQGPSRQT